MCFKVKQNFSSKNLCSLLPGLSFCLHCPFLLRLSLSHKPGSIWISQTPPLLIFILTLSVTLPESCLWVTLIAVLFHAGTASFLEKKVPKYCKLLERQCEIPTDTSVTDQTSVQHNICTARHQASPAFWSISCPH